MPNIGSLFARRGDELSSIDDDHDLHDLLYACVLHLINDESLGTDWNLKAPWRLEDPYLADLLTKFGGTT